ncbi:MAG: hypothetical protein MI976_18805 [Pseudomonadales bacterium]|nr:hypothetical protein [Pseudomonadales bacterium]
MRVLEAIRNPKEVRGKEVEISGIAHVSNDLSMIYDAEECREQDATYPGILYRGDSLFGAIQEMENPPAILVGSCISYMIDVKIRGIIGAMGYKFAPLIFGHLYSVSIQNEFGDYELFTINEYLLDLYFRVDRNLTANETRMFSSYFSGYSNMVELKKMLECGDRTRLVSRVSESEMKTHIEFLSKLNIEYSTSRSPIEGAVYGLP